MQNSKRPVISVIAGPNGSGKTTVTRQLLGHDWSAGAEYINPDEVAIDLFGGMDREANIKALNYCRARREDLLESRSSVVFETVFSGEDKLDYLRRAKEAGFFIRLFFVCLESPELNAARVARRVMAGGHTVPIEKIISRYYKSIQNCVTASGIADRIYIYDNSEENKDARLLFRVSNGYVVKQYAEHLPAWAEDIRLRINLKRIDFLLKDYAVAQDVKERLATDGECLLDGKLKPGAEKSAGAFLLLKFSGVGITAEDPGNPASRQPLKDYIASGVALDLRPVRAEQSRNIKDEPLAKSASLHK